MASSASRLLVSDLDVAGSELRVLFAAAAGPRRGYGHLVRCLSFARALGVRPLIALRGSRRVTEAALALGADLTESATPRVVRALRPDVVIVDDPVEASARRWIKAARRAGALVVTVHDLGIGCRESDLVIDGSLTKAARPTRGRAALRGSRFAVLDPRLAGAKRGPVAPGKRVLIALGGGPRAELAASIAEAIAAADPNAEVRIAGGFSSARRPVSPKVRWIGAARGLAPELAQANVAVVGGGVSLYEACALGVPTVSVPVVKGQVATVLAFARKGAALGVPFGAGPDVAAAKAISLLSDPARQQRMSDRSSRLIDGLGASRAAAAVVALAHKEQV